MWKGIAENSENQNENTKTMTQRRKRVERRGREALAGMHEQTHNNQLANWESGTHRPDLATKMGRTNNGKICKIIIDNNA